MNKEFRNSKIKEAGLVTRKRHKDMLCKTYEVKLVKSHLSKSKVEFLKRLFLEAKWLYNYQLSLDNVFSLNDNGKISEVTILNKDMLPEVRELNTLSSHMKQELIQRTKTNIVSLAKLKVTGKSGKLRYKSKVDSIPLKQYNNTYSIKSKNYIKIQGYAKYFRVNGLDQIPLTSEYTRAILINKNGDYYLLITCYLHKEDKLKVGSVIGLDFGIKDNVTTSNGNKYNFNFLEPTLLKKTSKRLNKKKKSSKNRYKQQCKLRKQYQKLANKKKDTKCKFVSKLVKENDTICIQDESLHQWKSSKMSGFGRRIQHSIMGGIISDLKKKSETVIIDRYFPSTKLCPNCKSLNVLALSDRIYKCSCGYKEDRDIHAAKNVLSEGLRISTEHRNTMSVEKFTSIMLYLKWFIMTLQVSSLKQKAS